MNKTDASNSNQRVHARTTEREVRGGKGKWWGGVKGLGGRNLGHQDQDEDLQEDGQLTVVPGSRGRGVCKRAAFRMDTSDFFLSTFQRNLLHGYPQ